MAKIELQAFEKTALSTILFTIKNSPNQSVSYSHGICFSDFQLPCPP